MKMRRVTRKLTARASIEHLCPNSERHIADVERAKKKNEAIRKKGRIYYEMPVGSNTPRDFTGLGRGFVQIPGNRNASPAQWRRYLGRQVAERTHYCRSMADKHCGRRQVRRKIKYAIEAHLNIAPPQLTLALELLCKAGKFLLAEKTFRKWCRKNAACLRLYTGCNILGFDGHLDSSWSHGDTVYSRYSRNQKILCLNGIGSGGPWMVCADRLIRMGCKETDLRENWDEALWKFQKRCSKRVRKIAIENAMPVDVRIARRVDKWVDRVLPELGFSVEELKRDHLKRARGDRLEQLNREETELNRRLSLVTEELRKIQQDAKLQMELFTSEPIENNYENDQQIPPQTSTSDPTR